eukprot:GHVL01011641.1.p1 GENE.GHVL01011641.1~~GHVL01011641.1.p1  ORF type:complete len:209 (+),score=29.92 GHVL01011641.1:82-708(+)
MVFKLSFLLFTLVLEHVSTHHLRKSYPFGGETDFDRNWKTRVQDMGGETDFDCNWTTRVQDMELQDKLLVWLKLWNSVESDSKKAFMKQFLKEGNPSLGIVGNFNTRCMMSLASSRGKSIKKIDISHVNQELQEFDFKMKKKLNDDDTAVLSVLSVFENKDDEEKKQLLPIIYNLLEYSQDREKFKTVIRHFWLGMLKAMDTPSCTIL